MIPHIVFLTAAALCAVWYWNTAMQTFQCVRDGRAVPLHLSTARLSGALATALFLGLAVWSTP